MRAILLLPLLASLALAACSSRDDTRETTIVRPAPAVAQPGSTVVVPPGTVTKVCPQGYTTC